MHVGRISDPANTPHGRQAVAPSAVKPDTKMFTPSGLQDIPDPRALRADEIPAVIQEFRRAAAARISILRVDPATRLISLHGRTKEWFSA